jgi:hypothetical protein
MIGPLRPASDMSTSRTYWRVTSASRSVETGTGHRHRHWSSAEKHG